jgi:hypothetical protein
MVRSIKSNRGSVLLLTLCLIIGLAAAAYAVYDLSLGTYRLSQYNEYRARAKALADSELEYVYFNIENLMMNGVAAADVPAKLSDPIGINICGVVPPTPTVQKSTILATATPTSYPFAAAFQNAPEGWIVKRWVTREPYSGVQEGSVVYNYFTVRVEVKSGPSCPFNIDLYLGRQMNNSVASIFQYNIFSQGDLQFSPDGNTIINGDIAANGNVALGAHASGDSQLTMNAGVYWIPPTDGATINTSAILNPDGTTLVSLREPIWSTGDESKQVISLQAPLNLLGGLSAVDIATQYATGTGATNLFGAITAAQGTDAYNIQLATATNNVYRSVIAPPPDAAALTAGQHGNGTSFQSEYPAATTVNDLQAMTDNPGVAALRAYNRAGLIVTVNFDNTYSITAGGTTITNANFVGTVDGVANQPVITNTTMFDLREQKNVAITDIDVGALSQAISANVSGFNGVLYVYLAGSNSTTPAAIRLNNGSATPGYDKVGTPDGKGFTVATNGGIYVRGDYNTTTTKGLLIDATDGSTNTDAAAVINPAALMADQITVLSADWNNPLTQGNTDAAVNASHDPIATKDLRTVTKNTKTTIAAGLLTGDTTAQNGYSVYSGGGDNLVRFLEDWNYNNSTGAIPDGATANFFGSFGRLFSSTVFTGQWYSPTGSTDMAYVYNHPVQRLYSFNDTLKSKPPPCSPNITVYNRGNFFNW